MSLTHTPNETTGGRLAILAIVVLFGLPLFLGLGRIDLRNDEAIYSYSVDSILEDGAWLTPETSPQTVSPGDPHDREFRPFLEKPPLKFWIVAAPIKLGLLPHDEFGMRFWDALFGTLAFVYVFLIGRRLVDSVCGFGAVFFLFIQWWFVFRHGLRANVMEAALVLAYCGGIYHFLRWSESQQESRRWLHILSFAGWFTLGFMTKFVAVIFLPWVVGIAALVSSDWRRRLWTDRWRWLGGVAVAAALIVPWFAYEHSLYGTRFWQVIFGEHVYERMIDSLDPMHVRPWHYYLTELNIEMRNAQTQGWLLVGVVLWLVDTIRRRWNGGFLVIVWFAAPIGLISLSNSKIFHYTFPFLPAVALMAAYPLSLLVRMARLKPTGFDRLDALATSLSRSGWREAVVRFFTKRSVRAALFVIASVSFATALATLLVGPFEITAFGMSLLRNSSVIRPLVIAALCLLPLASAHFGILMAGLVLFLILFPLQRYTVTFEHALTVNRPLGAVRDCLVEKYEEIKSAEPAARSRLYVHLPKGEGLTHNYNYYFRVLDVWERPRTMDDGHLYSRLFTEGEQAPTIIFEADYLSFLQRVNVLDSDSAEQIPAEVMDDSPATEPEPRTSPTQRRLPAALWLGVGGDGVTEALILLPGPFATCMVVGEAQGGKVHEIGPEEAFDQ